MSDNKIALNFRLTIYIRYKDNNTGKAMSLVLCLVPSLNKNSLATLNFKSFFSIISCLNKKRYNKINVFYQNTNIVFVIFDITYLDILPIKIIFSFPWILIQIVHKSIKCNTEMQNKMSFKISKVNA